MNRIRFLAVAAPAMFIAAIAPHPIANLAPGMVKPPTEMLDMFGPEYKQQYLAAQAKLYQEGAPLRTVSASTTTDGSGRVRTTVATTGVTQLSAGNVNAILFDIPADYSKIDVSVPQSATASVQPDSASHAADSGASKSSLVKKGLKGLFGRPQ